MSNILQQIAEILMFIVELQCNKNHKLKISEAEHFVKLNRMEAYNFKPCHHQSSY